MRLNTIATTLRVHPRTILRALIGEENPYWAPGYDPVIRLAEVAVVFNCSPNFLRSVHNDQIPLFDQREAAKYLGMPLRTFRYRGYNPAMWLGEKVQRYTPSQLDKLRG